MASGRINRNAHLISPKGEGVGGECNALTLWSTFDDAIADRSGVTELPRLTSDPICTEDRRGGILISFGRNRRPSGVHNPFGCDPSESTGASSAPPITFVSDATFLLKGIGSIPSPETASG